MKKGIKWHTQSSEDELVNRNTFLNLLKNNPIKPEEMLWQTYLFLNRQTLARLIVIYEIYKKAMKTHGVIMQFGVYYGRDLALFINLRGMFESSNYTRKIIGFDTFEGLPELNEKDGKCGNYGDFSVPSNYEHYLEKILQYHENECYLSQIKKFELIKGNVLNTLPKYLEENQETVIALAYLDLDIYTPTKAVLDYIEPYLVKGSIVVFDELNFKAFPGETVAFRESKFNRFKLHTFPFDPTISYLIYGE